MQTVFANIMMYILKEDDISPNTEIRRAFAPCGRSNTKRSILKKIASIWKEVESLNTLHLTMCNDEFSWI